MPNHPFAVNATESSMEERVEGGFDHTSLDAEAASREAANRRLIQLVQDDPQRGTSQLFKQFSGVVNQCVLRMMGGDAEHDDIVQVVFCAIMNAIHQIREPDKLEAWVRSVTVNSVLQELRKRRFQRLFLRTLPETSMSRNFVQDVEARDLLQRARTLLDIMPDRERVVFILHHAESRTLQEVAEICGYSLATAKRRLARANRRFEQLAGRDPELSQLVMSRLKHSRAR